MRFFVRADSPIPDRRRWIVEQLQALSRAGAIDGYRTESWPQCVSLDDYRDQPTDPVLEIITQIESWAEREGVGISPPFVVRTQNWDVTDELDRQIRTPHLGLAIFESGKLAQFYPHHDDEGVRTVADGLERLTESLEAETGTSDSTGEIQEVHR